MNLPRIRFTLADAERANDAWHFSCGPAALCTVAGITPDELRPHLPGFDGSMSVTQMRNAIAALDLLVLSYNLSIPKMAQPLPPFGIVRIQFGGPWMLARAVGAREKHTYWIGALTTASGHPLVFDVSALQLEETHGWLPASQWAEFVAPRLLEQHPGADGQWWITHSFVLECEPGEVIRARRSAP